ncbi:acyl-CoA dehydrogenase family protein [Ensifer sp. WSM1721]|uniref:acyl-CoA dehydrogenase family protein n=1 Tax=Ensifer sp. WSM1721 TaxID=1041159 RepID=UPI0004B8D7AD|nr:acyl-CoA dehydrogenase family protein [Ensifer sp. WSM1721]
MAAAAEIVALAADAPVGLSAEALERSGLLAIPIPNDFDGADVSNRLIARVVSQIAEVQSTAARALASHFRALELVRNAGSEEQRRSIYLRVVSGERLSSAAVGVHRPSQRYVTDGIGFKVSGAIEAVSLGEPGWFALLALSEAEVLSLLLVQRGSSEVRLAHSGEPALYNFDQVHVPADSVLALNSDALPLSQSLGSILHASTILGEKRRKLAAELRHGDSSFSGRLRDERIGRFRLDIEILAALIERAATALDLAQVNATPADVSEASRIATALEIAALPDGARETPRLLAELGQTLTS